MKRTIRQLREERGESLTDLATVLGATSTDINDLEDGIARPSVIGLHQLAEHFGVSQDDLDLDPNESPSLGDQIVDAFKGP